MADTILGEFPKVNCSDCGKEGCVYRHWGLLVPKGKVLTLCVGCWDDRVDYYSQHGCAKPVISQEEKNHERKL